MKRKRPRWHGRPEGGRLVSGGFRVKPNDADLMAIGGISHFVIASRRRSNPGAYRSDLDCSVAALLAMRRVRTFCCVKGGSKVTLAPIVGIVAARLSLTASARQGRTEMDDEARATGGLDPVRERWP